MLLVSANQFGGDLACGDLYGKPDNVTIRLLPQDSQLHLSLKLPSIRCGFFLQKVKSFIPEYECDSNEVFNIRLMVTPMITYQMIQNQSAMKLFNDKIASDHIEIYQQRHPRSLKNSLF